MFKKKFKVRVSRYIDDRYVVQWCEYRFIPIWRSLLFWFDQGHPGGTQCWSPEMWNYKKAEEIASTLKTKKDVDNYYIPYVEKCKRWTEEEEKYIKENMPYSTKIINP